MCIELNDFYLGTPMNWYEYMWIKMANIPQDIINQYGLTEKAVNGKVLVEIRKGMYGLKQAGPIVNDRLKHHLKASGYVPCKYTPGLFSQISRKISFALFVNYFGVKYTNKADAQHLLTCLEQLYKCTTYREGKLYLGMTLNCNYAKQWMEKSMLSYIDKVWTRFYGATVAPKSVEAPHAWTTPQYGSSQPQLTSPIDSSPLFSAPDKTRLQEIAESLLYFPHCINSTILATLRSIGTNIAYGTERVAAMAAYLLNFCANNRNTKIRYFASDIQLCGHTDASYMSVSKARSRAAAYFYLSTYDGALLPTDHKLKLPARPNGTIHVMSTVMRQVLSSATEAEVGATFYGCQYAVPLRNTLADLGHV